MTHKLGKLGNKVAHKVDSEGQNFLSMALLMKTIMPFFSSLFLLAHSSRARTIIWTTFSKKKKNAASIQMTDLGLFYIYVNFSLFLTLLMLISLFFCFCTVAIYSKVLSKSSDGSASKSFYAILVSCLNLLLFQLAGIKGNHPRLWLVVLPV